jgi:3-oxoacyl-[acyl-carrier-protein] synthase-1/3-oxoacyl-[acyl-carrier-protein] synthase II
VSRGGAIVAFGAVSPLGEGAAAASAGAPGERARLAIRRDEELVLAGLARPFAARARLAAPPGEDDRATALLAGALGSCAAGLDRARPGWRRSRVGAAIGTSSGGMRTAERFFAGEPVDPIAVTYFGPLHAALARLDLAVSPAALVLGACASASIAIGLATRWIEEGRCDVALAGGFDAVSVFVAAGFEALRATTASPPPRPFRLGRDGMALGEGAAIVALVRPDDARGAKVHAYVSGFAASCDAVHVTAPDREGKGLARAAEAALAAAQVAPDEVDLVSTHGTATPYNDASEARAMASALGARAKAVAVHPFKAQIGHTLGAAGALETLACVDAMTRGLLPAAAGEGVMDDDAAVRLLDVASDGEPPRVALKLASAFGGANAALVLSRSPPRAARRAPRAVYVTRAVHVTDVPGDLAARVPAPTLARADRLTLLGLAALATLEARVALSGAGIVAGHALATLETNALFDARMRSRGARSAEPRRFPYTSPNAVCGECAVVFGLTGPAFAVGAGPTGALEALAVARDLVAAGDADRVVVLAVDEVGPAALRLAIAGLEVVSGGVAALVTSEAMAAAARIDAVDLGLGPTPDPGGAGSSHGHRALVPLARERLPNCLEARGLGAFAKVTLVAL